MVWGIGFQKQELMLPQGCRSVTHATYPPAPTASANPPNLTACFCFRLQVAQDDTSKSILVIGAAGGVGSF
jgi:NADPH:quinone reductase-like Zn-dependent oxidoreductase